MNLFSIFLTDQLTISSVIMCDITTFENISEHLKPRV